MYLKTIHNAYGNNIKGHNLASLYKGIPIKGKEILNLAAMDIRSGYSFDLDLDFPKCLEMLSKAFVQWRYIHEHNNIGFEIQPIRYSMHVGYEACSRIRNNEEKT